MYDVHDEHRGVLDNTLCMVVMLYGRCKYECDRSVYGSLRYTFHVLSNDIYIDKVLHCVQINCRPNVSFVSGK